MIALTRSHQIVLVSVLSLPMMVTIGAIGHLLSLDASRSQPLNVPALDVGVDPLSLEQSRDPQSTNQSTNQSTDQSNGPVSKDQMRSTAQTDRERKNVALNQLQDGDWLMKQGDFKAAKVQYKLVLDRLGNDETDDSELREMATRRLDKLEKAIVAINKKDVVKRNTTKNLKVKPVAKIAIQPSPQQPQQPQPIIGTGMTAVFPVDRSNTTQPQAISAIETDDSASPVQSQPQSKPQSKPQVPSQLPVQFVNAPVNVRMNVPIGDGQTIHSSED